MSIALFRRGNDGTIAVAVQGGGISESTALAGLSAIGDMVSSGIDAIRGTTQNALSVAHSSVRSSERVAMSAIASVERVSAAAMETSRLQHKEMADVAKLSLHNNELMLGVLGKQQEMNQKISQNFANALDMDRRNLRIENKERLIFEMESALSDWQLVADRPENVAAIAERNVNRLKRTLRFLRKERKNEVRLARERLAVISAPSRSSRISLVSRSIHRVVSALEAQKTRELAILVFAAMVFVGGVVHPEPASIASVTLLSGLFMYRSWNVVKDLNAKKKWMRIYMGALNQLEVDPKLTVRNAVKDRIMEDPVMKDKWLHSAGIENLLTLIPDVEVVGDPHEVETEIPGELRALLRQVEEPPEFFKQL